MKALLLLLGLFAAQSSRPTTRPMPTGDGPAPTEIENLKAPSLKRKGVEPPPEDGVLGRNSGVAGRFTEEGTDVDYTFEARAGEVSLFQLEAWGFSRGWQSTARIRILDEAGLELSSRTRAGGTRFELFFAFEAPYDGTFHCEVEAVKEYYRYTLIRHSDFPANFGERIELERGNHSYAFLADSASRMVFAVHLDAGQEALFTAINAGTRASRTIASVRESKAREGEALEEARMEQPARAPRDWPTLALRVIGATDSREAPSHYQSFTPDAAGVFLVEVWAEGQSEGGFFELLVERDVTTHAVRGHVANRIARARAGVELRFYREPAFELTAVAVTDDTGNYEAKLPTGAYTVTMRTKDTPLTSLRTNVLGPRDLNTIYSKRRARTPTSRPIKR